MARLIIPHTDEQWQERISAFAQQLQTPDSRSYTFPSPRSQTFSQTIDHTLLKLDAQEAHFDQLCAEARRYSFSTVCVRPQWVRHCRTQLGNSDVEVASVVGFHEGTYNLEHKLRDAQFALAAGASELDIVINYPELQQRAYTKIYAELRALRDAAPPPTRLKLILETSQLNNAEIIAGCMLAGVAGYDYVKTSTGFNGPGAQIEHVRLMRECCMAGAGSFHGHMQVKASGGIRSLANAVDMLRAGATRLGTSAGVLIAEQAAAGGGSKNMIGEPAGSAATY